MKILKKDLRVMMMIADFEIQIDDKIIVVAKTITNNIIDGNEETYEIISGNKYYQGLSELEKDHLDTFIMDLKI